MKPTFCPIPANINCREGTPGIIRSPLNVSPGLFMSNGKCTTFSQDCFIDAGTCRTRRTIWKFWASRLCTSESVKVLDALPRGGSLNGETLKYLVYASEMKPTHRTKPAAIPHICLRLFPTKLFLHRFAHDFPIHPHALRCELRHGVLHHRAHVFHCGG